MTLSYKGDVEGEAYLAPTGWRKICAAAAGTSHGGVKTSPGNVTASTLSPPTTQQTGRLPVTAAARFLFYFTFAFASCITLMRLRQRRGEKRASIG